MGMFVTMPKFNLTMTYGSVEKWKVAEGEVVQKGQAILDAFSDKMTQEVEAPCDGVLLKILVAEDDEVDVGTPLAYIGAPGESFPNY